ncbi:hypothetical protein GIY62_17370 [Burkholderia plantarii]|uniref:hypothetical protein n=1 Tax=Burkholderia plantarii TaxID=41899 RepID=UPI00272A8EDF|nr:hypothetical protein [Burkholderia plantarii]WLE58855.1 hypothetical protein GIY62_17370 [Burkholderia plantarii]
MNSETHDSGFCANLDYEVMCGIIGQRIAQLATAIDEEWHRPAPDALHLETLELQQTRLRRLRDEIRPCDAFAIARHTAHFGRVVREHHAEAAREMQSARPTR